MDIKVKHICVKRIGIVLNEELPLTALLRRAGTSPFPFVGKVQWIDMTIAPTCKYEEWVQNGLMNQKTTLRFQTLSHLAVTNRDGLIVEDTSGATYLIGSQDPPCLLVRAEHYRGTNSRFDYLIIHAAVRSLVLCSV